MYAVIADYYLAFIGLILIDVLIIGLLVGVFGRDSGAGCMDHFLGGLIVFLSLGRIIFLPDKADQYLAISFHFFYAFVYFLAILMLVDVHCIWVMCCL